MHQCQWCMECTLQYFTIDREMELSAAERNACCKGDALECSGLHTAFDADDIDRHCKGRFQRKLDVSALHDGWQSVIFNQQIEIAATSIFIAPGTEQPTVWQLRRLGKAQRAQH